MPQFEIFREMERFLHTLVNIQCFCICQCHDLVVSRDLMDLPGKRASQAQKREESEKKSLKGMLRKFLTFIGVRLLVLVVQCAWAVGSSFTT